MKKIIFLEVFVVLFDIVAFMPVSILFDASKKESFAVLLLITAIVFVLIKTAFLGKEVVAEIKETKKERQKFGN